MPLALQLITFFVLSACFPSGAMLQGTTKWRKLDKQYIVLIVYLFYVRQG